LVGVAVKVTRFPWHAGFMFEFIVTLTGMFVPATMVMGGDIAGLLVIQVLFEVRTQVTISHGVGIYVYEGVVATTVPFTFHW